MLRFIFRKTGCETDRKRSHAAPFYRMLALTGLLLFPLAMTAQSQTSAPASGDAAQTSEPTADKMPARLALVIGQSAYRAVAPLPNPANDAKAVTKMLDEAGFEVSTASDLSQFDLRASVSEFAAKLADKGPESIALVFYAGHGIQVDGENFLIPVDIDPKREADIPMQAVRLNDVLNTLASVPSRMRIIMLDACRNNPFPAVKSTTGSGLAMVDAKTGAAGTFISYSTSPGAEAEDGSGANSPYTTALLKVAREPGLTIEEAFKRVRVSVNQETGGRQVPWDSSSLTDTFNFFGGAGLQPKPAEPPRRTADEWRGELQGKDAQTAYELVIAEDSLDAYEVFVALYGQSPLAPRVRSLLERRNEMDAWRIATLNNTVTSYQAFLASFGASDLAATARRLQDRARTRSLDADKAPQSPASQSQIAAAPSCQCSTPTPPERKQPAAKQQKGAASPPPARPNTRPPPRRPPPVIYEDDIYYPPPRYPGPGMYVPPPRRPPVYVPPPRRPPPGTDNYGRDSTYRDAPYGRGFGGYNLR